MKNPLEYQISRLFGFLLGTRFFITALLTFALYVSTFFLFNQEESLRNFVFDYKVHGIIFCAVLSILSGGIINQFYDQQKDSVIKPFRTKLQNFIRQKYFLYAYISLIIISLGIAGMLSYRVFLFFFFYQFLMWFYSHKISKILILNNLTFVGLTLYPFFGMLIYYNTFSGRIFLMAVFLFLILLIIDIQKDTITKNVDKIFGYTTIPNFFNKKIADFILQFLCLSLFISSLLLVEFGNFHKILEGYFFASIIFIVIVSFTMIYSSRKIDFWLLNSFRIWIFVGILAMLLDGILTRI